MLVIIFLVASSRCCVLNSHICQSGEGRQEVNFVPLVCFVWTISNYITVLVSGGNLACSRLFSQPPLPSRNPRYSSWGKRPPSDRCLGPDSSSVAPAQASASKRNPLSLIEPRLATLWPFFHSPAGAPPSAAGTCTWSRAMCVLCPSEQISPSVCDCSHFPGPAACFSLSPAL